MALVYADRSRHPGRKRKPGAITLSIWDGPTAERLRHAKLAGAALETEGEGTTLKRRRFISPLESLRKAGELNADQFGAARRYQRDADIAAVVGPGSAVRYEPRWIDDAGAPFLLPAERAADYLIRLARAQAACGRWALRMLDWIAQEPCGWRQQARLWYAGYTEAARERRFLMALRGTCNALDGHYASLR